MSSPSNPINSSNLSSSKTIMPLNIPVHRQEDEKKSEVQDVNSDDHRVTPRYMCEDCGLHFKDAPSRNRHQTLAHYFSDGRLSEAGSKKISTSEGQA